MKNLISETLAKIKKQNIKPEPRWKYLLRKYFSWLVFACLVLLGAISLAVAYDALVQLDWDLYRFVSQSPIIYTFSMLPYLWLFLIGIFSAVSFFDLRRTETGYRYSWLKMSLIAIGSMLAVGLIFASLGLGGKMNNVMIKSVPYYGQHLMMTKETQWMQPQQGLLAGTVVSVSGNNITLNDLNGKNWQVIVDEKTLIRPRANVAQGEMVKIIGSQIRGNNFQAIEVRPWMGMGMMGGQGQGQGGRMMNSGGNGMMRAN